MTKRKNLNRQEYVWLLRKQPSAVLNFASVSGAGLLTTTPKISFFRVLLARANGAANGGPAKKRIMLVDDEKDISMVLKSGLERRGFSVEVHNNPFDALSHFKPDYYDLLLLDIRMPGMSGFELYDEIKKQDRNVKVRMISAFEVHEDESSRYFTEEKTDRIIKKPISVKALTSIIDSELSGKN